MKGYIKQPVTPQDKIVGVNNKFGNTNIKNQQGTTRVLYDSLPIDGRTTFRFFENANNRSFPLTNIGSEGNRLEVGSTFVIEKLYFYLVQYDAVNNTIVGQTAIGNSGTGDFWCPFASGEFDFIIANSQVIKQLPTTFSAQQFGLASFNPTAVNTQDVAFGFATDIVIPPLLEYVGQLRTTSYDLTGITLTHLQCYIQGTAGIIAPQTTF